MIFAVDSQRLLALHYVYPLPLQKLQQLLSPEDVLSHFENIHYTEIAKVLQISARKAFQISQNFRQIMTIPFEEAYARANIFPIPFYHPYYPAQLFEISSPPTVLYVKGRYTLLTNNKQIAIIGSRKATAYSLRAIDFIIPPLVQHDYTIVSGLAKGADTMAHKATIKMGGQTIAVLGHGFNYLYPKENQALAKQMTEHQLLVTEYPPYMKPEKWHFPMRNRIISGLAQALVVTEAALKSGTMITTELALEQGKDVFVVPGPIDAEQSKGTNQLLLEGAFPVINGHQIIEQLDLFSNKN
ncbi:DNA-protecting protein DprA [Lysinibacillus macroides]|uniref:DNA processing protein n=1 Tax=Lysinibacillus macroides TaxID=33935 RepID=A0A0N0UWY2_9BACI|nr:DNA-processing protein DprA [Lysinibacillus macroides]KOY82665.1 DNA processing protein [Lysinibacillus macroides]QPR66291.1 DNA-protecting protein DprA [Lysinibacillus macroides]